MTVASTHISWTDTTWNPTVGCSKVSPGCDNCYAEVIATRLMPHAFSDIQLHPERLSHAAAFKPVKDASGPRPRRVFVNSMSDLHHKDIPDAFRHQVYDAMEAAPTVVFQVLTKRAALMSQFIKARWPNGGVPRHIWHGVSVENSDPIVVKRIDILRRLKERDAGMINFLSVEPLVGPSDGHDYTGIDQVLIGGESPQRGRYRQMLYPWLEHAIGKAREAGAAIHFKQYGHATNNPVVNQIVKTEGLSVKAAMAEAVKRGLELAPEEKGGATFRGRIIRELPPVYDEIRYQLPGAAWQPSMRIPA